MANFDPRAHITKEYHYYGSYYYNNKVLYRNQLQIVEGSPFENEELFDALVIMMNPGSSEPAVGYDVPEKEFGDSEKTNWCLCKKPDNTQYQITLLMQRLHWKKAKVINLFDWCAMYSSDVYDRYSEQGGKVKREHLRESVFEESRRQELDSIIESCTVGFPIILAWGVHDRLEIIRSAISKKVLSELVSPITGYENRKGRYCHPWPSSEDSPIRLNWVDRLYTQLCSKGH
jgi:hypothetical protein